MHALDPGGAARLRLETEPRHEAEHEIRGAAGEAPQPLTAFAPNTASMSIRIVFEARNQLSAIAARGAPARRMGVEDDDAAAGFGEMERRRETEIAGRRSPATSARAGPSSGAVLGAATAVSSQRLAWRLILSSSAA